MFAVIFSTSKRQKYFKDALFFFLKAYIYFQHRVSSHTFAGYLIAWLRSFLECLMLEKH